MSTERSYRFTYLLQFSKKSLRSLILYNCFHDLIHVHVYSPGAGILMSTETCCHFGRLLLVSMTIVSEKSIVLPFPLQKHLGQNLTLL